MDWLNNTNVLALDTETTGLRYPVDRVFGASVATPNGFRCYWDTRREAAAWARVVEALRDWANRGGRVVCHNASFDYRMLHASGHELPLEAFDDTVIRAAQINEHEPTYELDFLGKKYLGRTKDTTIYQAMAELFGGSATRNAQIHRISEAPPEVVEVYATEDADICMALWLWQEERIRDSSEGLRDIVEFERSLMPEFIRSEMHGIRVDEERAIEAAERIGQEIPRLQAELDGIFGEAVNADSSPQIKKLFEPYQKEGGDEWYVRERGQEFLIGTTPKGGASLKAEYLRGMADSGSRAADLIVQLRSLRKTKDTFLMGHVVGHTHGGRVFPNINQSKGEDGGTGTGRLSYVDPALQQIPSRNKAVASVVKDVFLPDEGQTWVDYDVDGFEVIVFAHLVNDPGLNAAYAADPNLDLHQYVADITGLPRNPPVGGAPNGKQLNLSMIFTQGDGATADKMGLPWDWEEFTARDGGLIRYKKPGIEAQRIIADYHRKVPGVKTLMKRCRQTAERYGYIKTRAGRIIRFPRGYKTYKASGLLIQSTAADINKKNWRTIREALSPIGGRLLLNTHDSYGTSVPVDRVEASIELVREAVESTAGLRIPVRLSCSGHGQTWWEAVKGDD